MDCDRTVGLQFVGNMHLVLDAVTFGGAMPLYLFSRVQIPPSRQPLSYLRINIFKHIKRERNYISAG